jgi:acetyl esterase/lipase
MSYSCRLFAVVLALVGTFALAGEGASSPETERPYLLHLNGIGGLRNIDRWLVRGIVDAGLDAEVELYDWTTNQTGIESLINAKLHDEQSTIIARKLEEKFRQNPARRIIVTGHSAGAGIAVYALKKLPEDVTIDTLVLLQPALSPQYDLTRALRHVRTVAYSFHSEHDPVLGPGTKLFGTIDGPKTEAAGRVGFAPPEGADEVAYSKFKQFEYDNAWAQLDHSGDHIGVMMHPFAKGVVGPLLLTGRLPKIEPATRPSTTPPAPPSTRPSGASR